MAKLWLTYAWKDNQDQDVDHVIGELKRVGLDVAFDRAHIVPGQRLWSQIDRGISDPQTDGWAILATENSLSSEPCLEELAYALDRALRTRGAEFPLIGIFPGPIDRHMIPSAIATRLYVNLRQSNWALLVADGVEKRRPSAATGNIIPFVARVHEVEGAEVLEVRPRSGRWYPGAIGVPKSGNLAVKMLMPGPSGHPTLSGLVNSGTGESQDGQWAYTVVYHAIDALNALYATFEGPLKGQISFGGVKEGGLYTMDSALIPR
jgi:TIR domain-containing protein